MCLAHEAHNALIVFQMVSKHPHGEKLVQVRPQHEDGRNIFDTKEVAYWLRIIPTKAVDFSDFKILCNFVAPCRLECLTHLLHVWSHPLALLAFDFRSVFNCEEENPIGDFSRRLSATFCGREYV